MATSNLLTHCGARLVTRDELADVPAPPATATWFPLSHLHVLDRVKDTLQQSGFHVQHEKLALTRGNARFFGTLDLASAIVTGVTLAVGVRNSIDKSLPIAFAGGHRVFVCDNLCFRGEITVARKHTRNGEVRFGEAIARAVQGLQQFRESERQRITSFQNTAMTDVQAESLLLRAYEHGIVSHRLLPRAIAEWRNPSFEEFHDRTFWSLLNAFTTVLADRQQSNPQQFASLTIRLSDLLGAAAGMRQEETVFATAA